MESSTLMAVVRIVGALGVVGVVGALAARRVVWLSQLVALGAPMPERTSRGALVGNLRWWFRKIFLQEKLLRWSLPGIAHFWVMYAFFVLQTTLIELFGEVVVGPEFQIPLLNRIELPLTSITLYDVLGASQDTFIVLTTTGVAIFVAMRLAQDPRRLGRSSRFSGSNLNQGWWTLLFELLVAWTLLIAHGARFALDHAPTQAAFLSRAFGQALAGIDETTLEWISLGNLLLHLAIVGGFLLFTLHSKHLHILTIPVQELVAQQPSSLGEVPSQRIDMEEMDEDTVLGVGAIEQFPFKGMLDMMTCTECGRCQTQCPAWNTGKPLSPKLLIMDLRDHLYAQGDELLGKVDQGPQHGLPLVGDAPGEAAVIDYDVLWSCTTCGACVEECPVDIEHVNHIVGMRRYKAMMESSFPAEAGTMLRNIENSGDPWGIGQAKREEWTERLDFEIPVAQPGTPLDDDIEYLFWTGCAGAVDDRSKKITQATATLLHEAGVRFAILGSNETCTGDPARRLGMEYLFQMLAEQNVETLDSVGAGGKKIVAWCPHCFNTLKNEYPAFDGHYTVLHHSEVLAQLVEDGNLVATQTVDKHVTYHDPCYLGRHNEVYSAPRKVVDAVPGIRPTEMTRCRSNGFCCGAGGARMWMEEDIGQRVNVNRVEEALELNPDLITTACPYCTTMLSDGVALKVQQGELADGQVEVLDVSEVLQRGRMLPMAAQGVDGTSRGRTGADEPRGGSREPAGQA